MNKLELVADLLEKVAAYAEASEQERQKFLEAQQKTKERRITKEASVLARQYKKATGEKADLNAMKKIAASADPDVKATFKKLTAMEEVDSMGSGYEKQASAGSVSRGMSEEDARFLGFVLGGSR